MVPPPSVRVQLALRCWELAEPLAFALVGEPRCPLELGLFDTTGWPEKSCWLDGDGGGATAWLGSSRVVGGLTTADSSIALLGAVPS